MEIPEGGGHVNAQQAAPHDTGDQNFVPSEVVPSRAQTQQNDAVGGDGIEKEHPVPALTNIKAGQQDIYQQCHKPDQQRGKTQDDILVCFALQGFFRYLRHGLFQRTGADR